MAGSTFGKIFKVTTWGEARGADIGVVIEGVPAGLAVSESDIQAYLNRRRADIAAFAGKKHDSDFVSIHSGIYDGMTTGTPISLSIMNSSVRSKLADGSEAVYRPGQADYTYDAKYGIRDLRGDGRDSDRENAARTAAGAVASLILNKLGISLCSYVKSIGPVSIKYANASFDALLSSPLNMPDPEATAEAMKYLEGIAAEGNSAGGVVEVVVSSVPAGIGEPVFDKLEACLAKAVMSVGPVTGFEIGDGFLASENEGAKNNDTFIYDGHISKATNHSGGVLGGISDGSEIIIRAAVKPDAAIGTAQNGINSKGEPAVVEAASSVEVALAPKTAVVVEAMVAMTLVDLLLENMSARMDSVVKFYKK